MALFLRFLKPTFSSRESHSEHSGSCKTTDKKPSGTAILSCGALPDSGIRNRENLTASSHSPSQDQNEEIALEKWI